MIILQRGRVIQSEDRFVFIEITEEPLRTDDIVAAYYRWRYTKILG